MHDPDRDREPVTGDCPAECLAQFVPLTPLKWLLDPPPRYGGPPRAVSDPPRTVGDVVRLYRDGTLTGRRGMGPGRARSIEKGLARAGLLGETEGHGAMHVHPAGGSTLTGAVIAACTSGGMSQREAAAGFGVSRDFVRSALRNAGKIPRPDGDWISPGTATALGELNYTTLAALRDYGVIRATRATANGYHLYHRQDVAKLPAMRRAAEQRLRFQVQGTSERTASG